MSPQHKFSRLKYNILGCESVLICHMFNVVSEELVVPIFILNVERNGGLFTWNIWENLPDHTALQLKGPQSKFSFRI
jgi:hypothetical protein